MKKVLTFLFAFLLTGSMWGQSFPFARITPFINNKTPQNEPAKIFPARDPQKNQEAVPAEKPREAAPQQPEKTLGYCEGHVRKVVASVGAIQQELARYNAPENLHNGRYEICFEINRIIRAERDQKLTIENNSNKEVVIGFLEAEKHNNSNASLPLLEIRGHNVTLFNPEISNVQKAVVMQGDGHKIVGGTIRGISDVADSICVNGSGSNIQIKDLIISACANGIKLLGAGHQIKNSQIAGSHTSNDDGGVQLHSENCLLLQNASNVTLEGNTFSYCHKGIYVVDSGVNGPIHIGPEHIENFTNKKNELHHNDYAIHAERSSQVFVRHNRVYENEIIAHQPGDRINFGLWLQELLVSLSAPEFVTAGEDDNPNDLETPIVQKEEENIFVEVLVSFPSGIAEIAFPKQENNELGINRYQPYEPFTDCPFENITIDPVTNLGTVRCPIQITEEIIGKQVLALLHAPQTGSSSYTQTLGIINDPGDPGVLSAAEMGVPGVVAGGDGALGGGPSIGGVGVEAGGGEESYASAGGGETPTTAAGNDTAPVADPGLEEKKENQGGEGIGAALPTGVTGSTEVISGGIDTLAAPGGVGVGTGGGKSGCQLDPTSTRTSASAIFLMFFAMNLCLLLIYRKRCQR